MKNWSCKPPHPSNGWCWMRKRWWISTPPVSSTASGATLLAERGVTVAVSRANHSTAELLSRYHLLELIGENRPYPTNRHAIAFYLARSWGGYAVNCGHTLNRLPMKIRNKQGGNHSGIQESEFRSQNVGYSKKKFKDLLRGRKPLDVVLAVFFMTWSNAPLQASESSCPHEY